MGLRTPEQYLESIRDNRELYYRGERVRDVTEHPVLKVGVQTCAKDFWISEQSQYRDLAVVQVDGEPVSRYFVPPRSSEDLLKRQELIQLSSRLCLGQAPFAKEVGTDGLNALTVVALQVDRQFGTEYARRVAAYREYLQEDDLAIALAMTDVKGDRGRRPSQQADPDLYVRIVDRKPGGIVVRGAKIHITTAPYTNEIMAIPTRAMSEADADWAVAFAVPANHPGVKLVARQTAPHGGHPAERPISGRYDFIEALVIYDDVFVPEERVFLAGEWQYAGALANQFATFHRFTASSYKAPQLELLAGMAYAMAEYNGLQKASHVKEKLAWLATYLQTARTLSRAAAQNPVIDEVSGIAYPNPIAGNCAKFFFAENYHQAIKKVQDISGGVLVTAPPAEDFFEGPAAPYVQKYLAGAAGTSSEERFRLLKLVRDLAASALGGFWEVTSIHAEGSLAAEELAIFSGTDWKELTRYAKSAAGIE